MPDQLAAAAADPNVINAIFNPANIVSVAVVGLLFVFYRITSQRFELEAQQQKDLILKLADLERKLTLLELRLENQHDHK
jgi:hypothetical protein